MVTEKEELLEEVFEAVIDETGQWTQEEAMYVVVPEIEHDCQKCYFFNSQGSCQLVEGSISPEGHCRLWVSNQIDDTSEMSLSQSISSIKEDKDFLNIVSTLQDKDLPIYKFETIVENLVNDFSQFSQELSLTKSIIKSTNQNDISNFQIDSLDTLYKKGLLLSKVYGVDNIPDLVDSEGKITKFSLTASIVGESAPNTKDKVRKLATKGNNLLKKYRELKNKKPSKKVNNLSQSEVPNLPLLLSNGMVKIPIAKKGNFFHEQHGIVSFTDEDFRQIKEQSSKEVLGFTPYITYGHPTDLPYNTVDAELKKGDLKGWEESEDVLFGVFEAKEDVFNLVKNGDYEYSSGEFLRNYKDKFTGVNKGTVLMRVALTNSPFIPFGNTKVEALSQQLNTEDNCLPKSIPFVIKLSTDIQENINPPISEEDSPELNMTLEKTPEQLAEEVVSQLTQKSESKVELPVNKATEESPAVNKTIIEEPKKEEVIVAATVPSVDINALLEKFAAQAKENTEVAVKAVKAESEAVINALKAQLESVTNQLTETKQVTQAFSTSLSNQAKLQEQRELLGYGVSPVLIQKFSQLQSALETKQTVVKLSTKAADGNVVESELPIVKVLKELLIDAVNSQPVNYQQFGQTSASVPANTLQAAIQQLAEENKALAAKKSL